MRRFLIYTGIFIGGLAALFVILVIGVSLVASNEAESERYGYIVGVFLAILIMVIAGAAIIFGMFKLTMMAFFRKEDPQEENVLDKDGPIDRYLK